MTKFLFTTLPTDDLGLLARSLPIADELARRGHTISFCSPARAPRRLVSRAGFENLLPRHPIYDLMATGRNLRGFLGLLAAGPWRGRHESTLGYLHELLRALPWKSAPDTAEVWNMDHAAAVMGMLNEGFVRACAEALRELMAACGAQVIVDFWNPFAAIAARALRLPIVSVIQADAHPGSQGFIWWRTPPAEIPTTVPVVNRVLQGYGLPAVGTLAELSVGDLTLVMGTPETDPLPADARVSYIGAVLWQSSQDSLPKWVDELRSDTPVIWVYSGNPRYSSGTHALDSIVVLRTCIAALANENVQVVLTTGHHPLPLEVLPLPVNFRHEAYVPGPAMASRSDLLIHHGGYGSCQTGLIAGKPAVILPTYSERESNARRLAAAGAAALVNVDAGAKEKSASADDLRATVRRVLADPSFARNAKRLGESLRAHGGAPHAADLIESFGQSARVAR